MDIEKDSSKNVIDKNGVLHVLPLNPLHIWQLLCAPSMVSQQQQQQHSLFSQASWGRLEMKPERNKFKVQAH